MHPGLLGLDGGHTREDAPRPFRDRSVTIFPSMPTDARPSSCAASKGAMGLPYADEHEQHLT
jgi:hypothetical protein